MASIEERGSGTYIVFKNPEKPGFHLELLVVQPPNLNNIMNAPPHHHSDDDEDQAFLITASNPLFLSDSDSSDSSNSSGTYVTPSEGLYGWPIDQANNNSWNLDNGGWPDEENSTFKLDPNLADIAYSTLIPSHLMQYLEDALRESQEIQQEIDSERDNSQEV